MAGLAHPCICPTDEVFLTLYRELYYRHIIARLQPDLRDRIASYEVRLPSPTRLSLSHNAFTAQINTFISGPVRPTATCST